MWKNFQTVRLWTDWRRINKGTTTFQQQQQQPKVLQQHLCKKHFFWMFLLVSILRTKDKISVLEHLFRFSKSWITSKSFCLSFAFWQKTFHSSRGITIVNHFGWKKCVKHTILKQTWNKQEPDLQSALNFFTTFLHQNFNQRTKNHPLLNFFGL